jgi:hypothetical protein
MVLALCRVKGDIRFLKLSAQIGYKSLCDDVKRQESGPYTALVWPLQDGGDPDEAFSIVPYEKVGQSHNNTEEFQMLAAMSIIVAWRELN